MHYFIIITELKLVYFNTFATQRLVFEENNKSFLLENNSSLTREFQILTRKFNKIQKQNAEKQKC